MRPIPGSRVDGRVPPAGQTRERRPTWSQALAGDPTPGAVGRRTGISTAVDASATAIWFPRSRRTPSGLAIVGDALLPATLPDGPGVGVVVSTAADPLGAGTIRIPGSPSPIAPAIAARITSATRASARPRPIR